MIVRTIATKASFCGPSGHHFSSMQQRLPTEDGWPFSLRNSLCCPVCKKATKPVWLLSQAPDSRSDHDGEIGRIDEHMLHPDTTYEE